jgi:3-methyl-2-oxobutanoate hydroxymethyltransferase
MSNAPLTVPDFRSRKHAANKIVMVTAYDATFASIFEQAGVDALLVGDSLGTVVQGHGNTLPVTLDQMLYHTTAVSRGARLTHIVGDMPFMSYQSSPRDAVRAAGRFLQEAGAHAVKLEGGEKIAKTIERIVAAGIPVMGHIGLTPQSVHQLGGYKIQGRDSASARQLIRDAKAVERAGCYSVVLEGMPAEVATEITGQLTIPTIGIGAGAGCDGQVLVCYDLLGLNPAFKPTFLKTYDNLFARVTAAIQAFSAEVKRGTFPAPEHCFHPARTARVRGEIRVPTAPVCMAET